MNAPPPLSAPLAPVVPNQRHAFGGVWRLTFRRFLLPSRWIMVLVGLAVLTLLCFASGHRGRGDAGREVVGQFLESG